MSKVQSTKCSIDLCSNQITLNECLVEIVSETIESVVIVSYFQPNCFIFIDSVRADSDRCISDCFQALNLEMYNARPLPIHNKINCSGGEGRRNVAMKRYCTEMIVNDGTRHVLHQLLESARLRLADLERKLELCDVTAGVAVAEEIEDPSTDVDEGLLKMQLKMISTHLSISKEQFVIKGTEHILSFTGDTRDLERRSIFECLTPVRSRTVRKEVSKGRIIDENCINSTGRSAYEIGKFETPLSKKLSFLNIAPTDTPDCSVFD